jgi:hypothetical protein
MRRSTLILAVFAVAVCVAAFSSGCNVLHHAYYVIKGNNVPAEFGGLKGKRVAVVCVSSSSSYGVDSETTLLANSMALLLRQRVPRISLVPQDEIADWIDSNSWDQLDYQQIGRGVKAEMLVVVELASFRYREDATLYQGKADLAVKVFDVKSGGDMVWSDRQSDFAFPANGGYHTTEMSESRFKREFIKVLAQQAAQHFYDYEFEERMARDARLIH